MGKRKKKERVKSQGSLASTELDKNNSRTGKFYLFIRHRIFIGIFLFLVSFAVFSPSLRNEFVWDDISYIKLKNYRNADLSNLLDKLLDPIKRFDLKPTHYRPILYSTWAIDRNIWGLSPIGFHLSNIVFYSISVCMFYFLSLLVLGEFRIEHKYISALLSSLLFAFFPLHVEPVSFIAARADLLCGIFFFLSIVFHILSFRKLYYLLLTCLSFYFSLLSKEVAITFPLVALCFDFFSHRLLSRSNLLRYAIYGVLFFGYLYLRRDIIGDIFSVSRLDLNASSFILGKLQLVSSSFAGDDVGQSSILISNTWREIGVLLNSYLFYLIKLIFPYNLVPFIPSVPRSSFYSLISLVVLAILCIIPFVSSGNKRGLLAFSIIWILINLIPPSIVAIYSLALTPLAERFLFIPSAGFCLLIGYLLIELDSKFKRKKIAMFLGLVLCLSYLLFTIQAQNVWRSSLTLWEYVTRKSPNQFGAHLNYGNALKEAGEKDGAIREYLSALRVGTKSGRALVYNNLGNVYVDIGDYKNAERSFRSSLNLKPNSIRTYYNLGYMYFVKGDRLLKSIKAGEHGYGGDSKKLNSDLILAEQSYELAERYLKNVLEIDRSYSRAYYYLAVIYARFGERDKAKEHAQKALESGLIEPFRKKAMIIMEMP